MPFEKVLKQPMPNKLRPKTTFEGDQIYDESTNYERFDGGPDPIGGGKDASMWTRVWERVKGSKDLRFGIPGLNLPWKGKV